MTAIKGILNPNPVMDDSIAGFIGKRMTEWILEYPNGPQAVLNVIDGKESGSTRDYDAYLRFQDIMEFGVFVIGRIGDGKSS